TRKLRAAGVNNPVLHFRSGADAFVFLKQFCQPRSTRVTLPAVLFLDINMQGLSGFDVLVWARTQPALARLKIFMLSGANEIWDAAIATKLGADQFLEKFPEPDTLRQLLGPLCAVAAPRSRTGTLLQPEFRMRTPQTTDPAA